jgi:hypothetical protein
MRGSILVFLVFIFNMVEKNKGDERVTMIIFSFLFQSFLEFQCM